MLEATKDSLKEHRRESLNFIKKNAPEDDYFILQKKVSSQSE